MYTFMIYRVLNFKYLCKSKYFTNLDYPDTSKVYQSDDLEQPRPLRPLRQTRTSSLSATAQPGTVTVANDMPTVAINIDPEAHAMAS